MTKGTGRYAPRGGGLRSQFDHSVSPEPNSGCWLWTGTTSRHGYGTLTHERRTLKAHRVSYELHRGPICDDGHVLHKCDVRCCVNPDHLFIGTNGDNVADKVAKGRQAKGEKMNRGSVTADVVRAIREFAGSTREAAAQFGVSKSHVHAIRAGQNWAHIT